MTESIDGLISAVREEADRAAFPIDEPVYRRSGRDPKDPILFAGTLEASLCIVGRDLGKDEVSAGQPLIGAAGRLVRAGIIKAFESREAAENAVPGQPPLLEALKHAVLTNTVPYKPPGNKAYAEGVRRRFRPMLERLLTQYWKGDQVITLGSESFQWFEPYLDASELNTFGGSDRRFEAIFHCRLPAAGGPGTKEKAVLVYPLPHPSPLNRRWYSRFPEMLAGRLADVRQRTATSPRT
jgi:uracil-DNA glycosylase